MQQSLQRSSFGCEWACLLRWCLLASVLALAACESTVDLDLPPHEARLVLRGFFSPQQTAWRVEVAHTIGVLDTTALPRTTVEDARVELFEVASDGAARSVAVLSHAGGGLYRSAGPAPVPGRVYRVVAEAPGYPRVTAEDRVPLGIEGVDVDLVDEAPPPDGRVQPGLLRVRFQEPPGAASYFRLHLAASFGEGTRCCVVPEIAGQLTAAELLERLDVLQSTFGSGSNLRGSSVVFAAEDVHPESGELAIQFARTAVERYEVAIEQLSAATYAYERVRARIQETRDTPFIEPLRPFSNVEGGAGVLLASTRHELADLVLGEITPAYLADGYQADWSARTAEGYTSLRGSGGSLTLTLQPDGQVTGQLLVPAVPGFGLDAGTYDVEGRFRYEHGHVYFDLTPETALNRLAFAYDGFSGTLGTEPGPEAEALITLRRWVPN